MSELPPLPEGATLDQPQSLPPLPEGAVLDSATPEKPQLPPLPEGATLDGPMPSAWEALKQGFIAGQKDLQTTGAVTAGDQTPAQAEPVSPAAQPFGMEDLQHPIASGLPKFAYQMAASHPMLAGAVAGGAAGELAFPEGGALPGSIVGAMGGAAAQTLGPAFKRELAAGKDPETAWKDAVDYTAKAGGFAGAMASLAPLEFLGGPIKNWFFQNFGIQPGIMVAQHAYENVQQGRPALEGAGSAYGSGVVAGVGLTGVHKGLELAVGAGAKALRPGEQPGVETPVPPPDNLPPLPEGATLDQPPPGQGPGGGEAAPPMPATPGSYAGGPEQASRGFWRNMTGAPELTDGGQQKQDFYNLAARNGLSVDETQDTIYLRKPDGTEAARMYWRDTPNGPQFGNVNIEEPYQRKGLASAAQAYLEARAGMPMIPDSTLSGAEYARWQKINPQAVEGYEQLGPDTWVQGWKLSAFNPLGKLRKIIQGARGGAEDNTTRIDSPAVQDPAESTLITGPQLDRIEWKRYDEHGDINLGTMLEDKNPWRYMIDGDPTRLYSSTDLEGDLAMRGNAARPKIEAVMLHSLDPELITAATHDLPEWNSHRVVLGDVKPEEYMMLKDAVTKSPEQARLAYMHAVQEKGLRVAPSVGQSFMYGGIPDRSSPVEDFTPTSLRSPLYFQDRTNTVLAKAPRGFVHDLDSPGQQFRTIDEGAVPDGMFVSADPNRVNSLVYPKDISPADKKYTTDLWAESAAKGDYSVLKYLYNEGVYVPAMRDLHGRFMDAALIATKDVPSSKIVPGYAYVKDSPVGDAGSITHNAQGDVILDKSNVPHGDPFKDLEQAQKIAEVLHEIKPVIDNMLGRLGAKSKPDWIVEAGKSGSPYVITPLGTVGFPSKFTAEYSHALFGDLKDQILQVAMHEIGHLVSYRSWERTPLDLKAEVTQGHERARLNYNITNDPSVNMTPFQGREFNNPLRAGYYLTFSEWQAEQFRRWSNSNQLVLTDLDRYMQGGAKKVFDYWDTVAKQISPEGARQMRTADYGFATWMDYLESTAHHSDSPFIFARKTLPLSMTIDTPRVPVDLQPAMDAVEKAAGEWGYLFPEGTNLEYNTDRVPFKREMDYGGYTKQIKLVRMMIGALAWIRDPKDLKFVSEGVMVHEAWHSVEDALKPGEKAILLERAKAEKVLSRELANSYYRDYTKYFLKEGRSLEEAKAAARSLVDNEFNAVLAEQFRKGARFDEQTNGILQKLSDFMERLGNLIRGMGFKTSEDILHSFYRGEITRRMEKIAEQQRRKPYEPPANARKEDLANLPRFDTQKGYPIWKAASPGTDATYHTFYDEQGRIAGHLDVDSKGEIQMIYAAPFARGKGVPEAMIRAVEAERGEPFKTAQTLTVQGYNMLKRRAPERVKGYVFAKEAGFYYSPKMIWEMLDSNTRDLKDPNLSDQGKSFAREGVKYWGDLAKQIKDIAEDDPALAQQWSRRVWQMDEWERDAKTRARDLTYRFSGNDQNGEIQSDYQAVQRQQENEANMRYGVTPQLELKAVNGIWKKYGESNPNENRKLYGTSTSKDSTYSVITPEWLPFWGNKMLSLGKQALTIRQLAWKNPHIPELQEYISYRDQENSRSQAWFKRTDDVAKAWNSMPDKQRDAVTELQFWATEMRYRTPAEVRQKVVRNPTTAELFAEARRLGLKRSGLDMFLKTQREFQDFLKDMENVFAQQINRRISDPAARAAELARLRADMVALRAKPYFPMTRFGEYSLTARDSSGKVQFFSLYATPADRTAAVHQVYNRYGGTVKITVSKVPEGAYDFMGLPGPLLERIKTQLPGVTPQQVDWIERFSQLMAPEQSFKKRWLARKGTPGYSLDGVRAYAQYFRTGSRYLARMEFLDPINDTMNRLDNSVKLARDGTSRQIIADMVRDHASWMNKPGKDWAALKSFFTNFHLAFSVKSAMMNLTQVPVVTYPYLASVFGEKAVLDIAKSSKAIGRAFRDNPQIKDPFLAAAHDEMVKQGRINIGQATELGVYANSDRMSKSYMGSKAQKAWQDFSWLGMYMFGKGERGAREWTFDSAMNLALRNPNAKEVVDLGQRKNMDLFDVMARRGWTYDQAQAFIFAREAIDKTQYVYQSWDRPKFLQSKLGSASRIFFMYTQQTLFALSHNNSMRMRMLLVMGALYGAMGLPGAEDINATVRALAKLIFGKDFNLEAEVRKFTRDLTKGTFLNEMGPDLLLHGISRYSMGTSWVGNFMGWPQFDLSGSGSMGSVIPGYKDLMAGYATSGADPDHWKDVTAKVVQDVGGPAIGMFVPALQWMNSAPYSTDASKWESVLPTAIRQFIQGLRVMATGEVQNRAGAAIANFDMSDPNDRMTVIASALGFRPRVMSELSDLNELMRDTDTYYKAQQLDLKIQIMKAIQRESQSDLQEALQGVKDYNAQVLKDGHPEYALKGKDLTDSIKQRMKNNAKTEAGIPLAKQQIPLRQDLKNQFPGLIDSRNVK